MTPAELTEPMLAFVRQRAVAGLTTIRPDGSPHVAGVGFSYDAGAGIVRIITRDGSRKVRNLDAAGAGARAAVFQNEMGRWLSLEGGARVVRDPDGVRAAVEGYTQRYGAPGDDPQRVAIEIRVERVLGQV